MYLYNTAVCNIGLLWIIVAFTSSLNKTAVHVFRFYNKTSTNLRKFQVAQIAKAQH
jgi:hypothetical protein